MEVLLLLLQPAAAAAALAAAAAGQLYPCLGWLQVHLSSPEAALSHRRSHGAVNDVLHSRWAAAAAAPGKAALRPAALQETVAAVQLLPCAADGLPGCMRLPAMAPGWLLHTQTAPVKPLQVWRPAGSQQHHTNSDQLHQAESAPAGAAAGAAPGAALLAAAEL